MGDNQVERRIAPRYLSAVDSLGCTYKLKSRPRNLIFTDKIHTHDSFKLGSAHDQIAYDILLIQIKCHTGIPRTGKRGAGKSVLCPSERPFNKPHVRPQFVDWSNTYGTGWSLSVKTESLPDRVLALV